jgi:hypothetical protein
MCGFSKTSTRFRVPGIGYRLSGTWDLVPGTGAGSTPRTEHRAPKTEPGHRKTRTPGLLSFEMRIWDAGSGFALRQGLSCILHPASCITRTPCAGFLKTSAWYRVPGPGYLAPGTRDPGPDQRRGPDTEHRRPSPATGKRAHRVCILYPASGPDSRVHAWGNGRGRTRGPMTLEGGPDPPQT